MQLDLGGFPIELVSTVRVPGLPEDGSLVTRPAELAGVEMPWFQLSDVANFFFQKESRWLRRRLHREENRPPVGHPLYFSPLLDHEGGKLGKGDTAKRWSLGEVERMVCWLHESRTIEYRKYLIARQIVAWVSRGYGVYDG